jgi:hypothetical protein
MSMLSNIWRIFGDEIHSVFELVPYWQSRHTQESRDEAKVKPRFAPRGEKLGNTRRREVLSEVCRYFAKCAGMFGRTPGPRLELHT